MRGVHACKHEWSARELDLGQRNIGSLESVLDNLLALGTVKILVDSLHDVRHGGDRDGVCSQEKAKR